MHCYVYASLRKPDTYLWLPQRDDLSALPDSLLLLLGELRYVLEVALTEQRKLPYEDAETILEHLRTQGWHLQLPPQETLATAHPQPKRRNEPSHRHDERED